MLQVVQVRVLCLGLGGGALPSFLQHHLGEKGSLQLSAAELDPVVVEAAKQCMGLDPQFGLHKAGARSPYHLECSRRLFRSHEGYLQHVGEGGVVAFRLLFALLQPFSNSLGQGRDTADYV